MIIAIAVFVFIILLIINMPISFAIGIGSVIAGMFMFGVDNATIVQRMMVAINSFPLLAVIFFIFAGVLMSRGGVSQRLVRMAEVIVGRVPGGLAQINILASMFFGGVSGSAVADVSSIGAMMIPAMEKDGYTTSYATAITLTSAIMGPIIPPSIAMIIFAHVAGSVSIAGLFLAGVIPGIMIGLSLMAAALFHGIVYHKQHKTPPVIHWREAVRRCIDGAAGMFTIVIILGGITSGLFTATEAGAVASAYGLILTVFIYKEVKIKELPGILYECCMITAVVLFLISVSSVFTWIMTYENFPLWVSNTLLSITDNKIVILLIINLVLLFMGMFIDQTPAIIMIVPILIPIAAKLNVHIIHLGAIVVINLCFGLITPPVGTSLFVGCRIAKIPMTAVIRPMLPLLAIMILVLMFVTFSPGVVLWLPRMFGYI
jgi:tripartite ATP-independent transporter DctM subunit